MLAHMLSCWTIGLGLEYKHGKICSKHCVGHHRFKKCNLCLEILDSSKARQEGAHLDSCRSNISIDTCLFCFKA